MKLKKILLLVCAVVSVTGISAYSVKAQMATVYREKAAAEENKVEVQVQKLNLVSGLAGEKGENSIIIKEGYNSQDIKLNIKEDTIIIDASTKLPVSLQSIEADSNVTAYADPKMTFSIPPMSNAEAVIVNKEENTSAPIYFAADEIVKLEDGSIIVRDADKNVEVTINADTSINPYKTRNIIRLDDIKAGDKLVVWKKVNENGIQTLELPEKITAESCIVSQA